MTVGIIRFNQFKFRAGGYAYPDAQVRLAQQHAVSVAPLLDRRHTCIGRIGAIIQAKERVLASSLFKACLYPFGGNRPSLGRLMARTAGTAVLPRLLKNALSRSMAPAVLKLASIPWLLTELSMFRKFPRLLLLSAIAGIASAASKTEPKRQFDKTLTTHLSFLGVVFTLL